MKKLIAITLGMLMGITSLTYAAPKVVETYLQNDFLIKVDGEFKYHPEGLKPLVYENRTYLPASFIAQLLGATTTFDSTTKTVNINSNAENALSQDKIDEYENKINELESKIKKLEESNVVNSNYTKMPARLSQNGYSLTLEGLAIRDDGNDGRLYFNLKNEDVDTGIKIESMSTVIESDGKKYQASSKFQENVNPKLFQWISRNDSLQTYIPFSDFPEDEKDIKEMDVTIVIEVNQAYPKKEIITFKVLND